MIGMLRHCGSEEDYRQAIGKSREGPVFLLKHSLTCGISTGARNEFQDFAAAEEGVSCWEMAVQEARDLSRLIASETGVRHESPQVLLFRDCRVMWSASHWEITGEKLRTALASS
jgi:bacillithiol system protein YtxJ